MGQSMLDFIHQCDCKDLREALDIRRLDSGQTTETNSKQTDQYLHRNILIRIKCTLTNRGKSVNIKSASYKVST